MRGRREWLQWLTGCLIYVDGALMAHWKSCREYFCSGHAAAFIVSVFALEAICGMVGGANGIVTSCWYPKMYTCYSPLSR